MPGYLPFVVDFMSTIRLAKWKYKGKVRERYVYARGNKRVYAEKTEFKSIKQFKRYIQDQGYLIGIKQYKARTKNVRVGVNVVSIESKEYTGAGHYGRLRIIGEYKGITGTSNLAEKANFNKSRIKGLKESAAANIAFQIYAVNNNLAAYDKAEVEDTEEYQEIFDTVLASMDSKYNYSYYKDEI